MFTRRWLAGSIAAGVLVLAGCAGAEPGVVAYVGDTPITQAELDSAVAGVSETVEPGQQVAPQAVTNVLIIGEVARQIAEERGIRISDAQRTSVLRQSNLAPLLEVPAARPVADDFADQSIVAERIGADAFLAELGRRDVTLNPRYGTLDPATKQIAEASSGSLSVPAPPAP